jgi:hypothetical protein
MSDADRVIEDEAERRRREWQWKRTYAEAAEAREAFARKHGYPSFQAMMAVGIIRGQGRRVTGEREGDAPTASAEHGPR